MARLSNPRHERFCREYVANGFVGTKAARSVGYASNSAHVTASQFLSNPKFIDRINELTDDLYAQTMMPKAEALSRLSALASLDVTQVFDENGQQIPIHELPKDVAGSIKEIGESGLKFIDPAAALRDVLRHYNAFEDHQKAASSEIHVHLDDKDADA